MELLRAFERASDVAARQVFELGSEPEDHWGLVFESVDERFTLVAILASPSAGAAAREARVSSLRFMSDPTLERFDVLRDAVKDYREAVRLDVRTL